MKYLIQLLKLTPFLRNTYPTLSLLYALLNFEVISNSLVNLSMKRCPRANRSSKGAVRSSIIALRSSITLLFISY